MAQKMFENVCTMCIIVRTIDRRKYVHFKQSVYKGKLYLVMYIRFKKTFPRVISRGKPFPQGKSRQIKKYDSTEKCHYWPR